MLKKELFAGQGCPEEVLKRRAAPSRAPSRRHGLFFCLTQLGNNVVAFGLSWVAAEGRQKEVFQYSIVGKAELEQHVHSAARSAQFVIEGVAVNHVQSQSNARLGLALT